MIKKKTLTTRSRPRPIGFTDTNKTQTYTSRLLYIFFLRKHLSVSRFHYLIIYNMYNKKLFVFLLNLINIRGNVEFLKKRLEIQDNSFFILISKYYKNILFSQNR